MATLSPSDARENTVTLASTTAGPINVGFRLFSEDILVYVDDVETTAFTLTATFEDGFEDDATITFDTAQDAGSVVTIQSNFQPERGSDYLPNDAQLTANLNIELGHLWGVNADVRRDYDRALKLPPGSTSSTVLPSPVANTRFGFDADGNPTLFAGAGSADVSTAMEPVVGAATLGAALTQLGITAFIQTLLDDADAATARATLGLVLGTNVQAYNALLADIAGLTLSAGDLLYFDGSNIVNLGKGSEGQVLEQGASVPQWAADKRVGVGQSWQDVSGSRTHSTSYKNETGKPIQLAILCDNGGTMIQASSDDINWVTVGRTSSTSRQISAGPIIPDQHYYRVNGTENIIFWSELR